MDRDDINYTVQTQYEFYRVNKYEHKSESVLAWKSKILWDFELYGSLYPNQDEILLP